MGVALRHTRLAAADAGWDRRTVPDPAATADVDALLLGESCVMRRLRADVVRAARTRLPVLIQGPTGAGKEVVAQALHRASGRRGALVAFNVCAVADTLFEPAVFGSVRGAFTGATTDTPGFLAEAHGGTVFLDEIGGLPLSSQAKLLRAVETQTFRPVGARADRRSDFRVVSATNEEVEALVDAGRFRADLAERLAGIVVHVPPLAAHPGDIPTLVRHFAARLEGAQVRAFTDGALDVLATYAWPRNVRELKHAVERALAWTAEDVVDADVVAAVLPRRIGGGRLGPAAASGRGRQLRPPCAHTAATARRPAGSRVGRAGRGHGGRRAPPDDRAATGVWGRHHGRRAAARRLAGYGLSAPRAAWPARGGPCASVDAIGLMPGATDPSRAAGLGPSGLIRVGSAHQTARPDP
jgi:DNA-binding NtrC family response regulator